MATRVICAPGAYDDFVAALAEQKELLAKTREQLAADRSRQQAADTDRHVRATAAEAEAKAKAHEDRSAALTRALDALIPDAATRARLGRASSEATKALIAGHHAIAMANTITEISGI